MLKRILFLSGFLMASVSVNSAYAVGGSANPVCEPDAHTLAYSCPAEGSNTVGGVKKLLKEMTILFGDTITLPQLSELGTACVTPDNKIFAGWQYNGTTYVAGSDFTLTTDNVPTEGRVDMTAFFADNESAVISYNRNGGVINDTSYSVTCTTTSQNIVLPTNVTRTGYTFIGWYDTNGDKVETLNKDLCVKDATIELTANWKENEISITFDTNGAEGSAQPKGHTCYYDKQCSAAIQGTMLKTNHVFMGWAKSATAATAEYKGGDSIKNITTGDPITLYAVWSKCADAVAGNNVKSATLNGVVGNVCKYTHVCDTGYYNENHNAQINNATMSCAACTNLPANAEWTGAATTNACAWDCEPCSKGENAESCAVAKGANTCIYTGTCKENTFKPTASGATVSCTACPANSTAAAGNNATSCTCIPNYSVGGTTSGATTTSSTQCSPIEYDIKYELDSGTNYNNAPSKYTYGTGVTINGVPTKAGYVFGGWCDADQKNCAYDRVISETATGTQTLYAKWTVAVCNATNATATPSVANNTVTCAVECDSGYSKTGAGDTTTKFDVVGDKNAASVDVECKIATHTITVEKNGGSGTLTIGDKTATGIANLVLTCEHGTTVTLPAWNGTTNALTKSNSVFNGWDSASVTCDADKTVTATWTTCGTCSKGTGVESCTVSVNNNVCVADASCATGYESNICNSLSCTCSPKQFECSAGTYLVAGATACTKCPAGSFCDVGTYTFDTTKDQGIEGCPTEYPNSAAGAKAKTECYSNTKKRTWTGNQVDGEIPASCSAVTEWNACSIKACDYVAYSNAAGTGDGTIKSGCETNADNCTKTVKSVTAKANHFVNGTTCSECPSGYPTSAGGAIDSTYCYTTCASKTGYALTSGVNYNGAADTCKYTANKYTVTYACGEGTGTAPSTATATYDANFTPAANTCTRDGYDFGGWKVGGTDDVKTAAFKWTYTEDKTFTAKWVVKGMNTISFNVDGGSSVNNTECNAESSDITLPTTTRTGYTFDGWYNDATDEKTTVIKSGTCTSGMSFTAKWTANTYKCESGTYLKAGATTCTQCPANSFCDGGTYTFDTTKDQGIEGCPTEYPNSAAGAKAKTECYSNTKKRTWTGNQVDGEIPASCSAVTEWNACSIKACDYVAYSNAAGTGDGDIKSGCETNADNCTKTAKSVTANPGAYVSGTACYPCSDGTYSLGGTPSTCSYCTGCTVCDAKNGNCSSCYPGYGLSGEKCKVCTGNTFSTGGANACDTCNAGYTANSGHTACEANKYTVTYACGEGTGTAPSTATATYDENFTPAANTCTRDGYDFGGWKVSGTDDVKTAAFKWTYTEDKTFTAKWVVKGMNTISFNVDGGSSVNNTECNAESSDITLPTTTRTGYTFDGWYNDATDEKTTVIKSGTCTSGMSFTAKWTANCNVITLNPNGGSAGTVSKLYKKTDETGYYSDDKCTVVCATTSNVKPTRSGYTFRGFYIDTPIDVSSTETNGVSRYLTHTGEATDTGISWTVKAPASLYAGWAKDCPTSLANGTCVLTVGQNTTYDVKCDQGYNTAGGQSAYTVCNAVCNPVFLSPTLNGGKGGTTTLYKLTGSTKWYTDNYCDYQKEVTSLPELPSKQNATFAGYYTPDGKEQHVFENGGLSTSWVINSDAALVAQYECSEQWRAAGTRISGACEANKYTVTYACGEGTGTAPSTATATYDANFTPAANTCTRDGYTFGGWMVSGTDDVKTTAFKWTYTENKTFTAKWVVKGMNTISFNVDGGSSVNNTECNAESSDITLPTTTRTGYTFDGWYNDTTDEKTTVIKSGTCTSGMSFTAKWTANTYNCSAGTYLKAGATTCTQCPANSFCVGDKYTFNANTDQGIEGCPTAYPNSAAGSTSITSCYSNTKQRAWTGSQLDGEIPASCSAVTEWNACSIKACDYVAYSNDDGTGDGDIKSGCATNADNCTKTVKSVTANPGAYVNGTTCIQCSEGTYGLGGTETSCKRCEDGTYNNAKGQTSCKSCPQGCSNACVVTTGKCVSCNAGYKYNNGVCTACTGNTYSTGGQSECLTCDDGYTANSGHTACEANTITLSWKNGGYGTAPTSPASCMYGSTFTAPAAMTATGHTFSGWTVNAKTFEANAEVVCNKDNLGVTSGTAVITAVWDTENYTCSAGTYLKAGATTCTQCPANSFCDGGTYTFDTTKDQGIEGCPTAYPNSAAGAKAKTECYSDTKKRAWTGNQLDGTVPTNCASVTGWNACSIAACDYVAYSNAAGTGDGAIKSGCETNADNCTKTVKSVTANPGAYVNGTTCIQCSAGYYGLGGTETSCKRCEDGTYSWMGQTSCKSCPQGCSNACVVTTGKCVSCKAGYKYNNGVCTACTGNTYSTGGQSECLTCDDGYTANSGHTACEANKYTVTYACGEGTLVSGADNVQNVAYDDTFTTRPASICVREGYMFVRWNGGEYTKADTTYTYKTAGNVTLTAQWTADGYNCSAGTYLKAGATTCTQCPANSFCVGGTYTFDTTKDQGIEGCPTAYPNSAAGAKAKTECYSNTKKRAWTGNQVNGTVPTNCASVTEWNACSIAACDYVAYSNAAGTGDGTIKSGCATNADNCTKTVKSVTAKANYYVNGATCSACPSGYPTSAGGALGVDQCYMTCESYDIVGGTAHPVSTKAYHNTTCEYYAVSDNGNTCKIEIVNGMQTCVEVSCKYDYEFVNGTCQPCDRDNATAYRPDGNCQVAQCELGYHPVADQCVMDVQECSLPNASEATKVWDAELGRFGECVATSCEDNYHLDSGACVTSVETCDVEHGIGTREWDEKRGTWGDCVATTCDAGYTNDAYDSAEPNAQCGRCRNATSVLGEPAASSYVSGCEIASCMYQGELYKLENNECVPICPIDPYEDETGVMYWNKDTKKCERKCFDGYMSW